MTIGQRIKERLGSLGMSQAELARRVPMSQSAMNNLIHGHSRSSTHLHKIASHLQTTAGYLEGEVDDPSEGAPAPAPQPTTQRIMMQVVLPAQPALADMFRGFLLSLPGVTGDELAHELATLLPIGLQQLRGPLRFEVSDDRDDARDHGEDQPHEHRERRRA